MIRFGCAGGGAPCAEDDLQLGDSGSGAQPEGTRMAFWGSAVLF